MVAAAEIKDGRYGEASDKSYDDIRDIDKVRSLITANPARSVDNLVIAQGKDVVRTALIAGPCIHGAGHGPVNQRSIQAPEITRVTLERKKGIQLGKGLNIWSNVHIHDLGRLFVALLDAALEGSDQVWNENGIYFPENGRLVSQCQLLYRSASLRSSSHLVSCTAQSPTRHGSRNSLRRRI